MADSAVQEDSQAAEENTEAPPAEAEVKTEGEEVAEQGQPAMNALQRRAAQAAAQASSYRRPKKTLKDNVIAWKVEIIMLGSVFLFISGVSVTALFLDRSMVGDVKNFYGKISGKNALSTGNIVADCQKKANRNKRYCVEHKSNEQAKWKAIKFGGKRSAAFSLHGQD